MFGPHVNREYAKGKRPSIVAHIRRARAIAAGAGFRARAVQVFVAGPRNLNVTMTGEEEAQLKKYVADEKIVALAHGTYLASPWGGNAYFEKFIRTELQICGRAGAAGLVVHLGTPPPKVVVAALPRLVVPALKNETRLYLEVPHVKPQNSHYETPEKLAALFAAVRAGVDPGLGHFGLCVDTAHLWSCGVDLGGYGAARAWLDGLEAVAGVIPPDRVVFHLNDSKDGRGSGLDHHETLGRGRIWAPYADDLKASGLAAFVEYAVKHDTPTILERKPPGALLDDYDAIAQLTTAVRLLGKKTE